MKSLYIFYFTALLFQLAFCSAEQQLKITGGGRTAVLGALYDATKNVFTGEQLLTNPVLSNTSVTVTDVSLVTTRFEVVNTFVEKLNLLGCEPSLATEIASGQTHSHGVVSSLQDHLENGHRTEAWLLHQIRTVKESISVLSDQVRPLVSAEVLKRTSATHYVSEIQYGFDILFKFGSASFKNKSKADIKADLENDINTNSTHDSYFVETFSDLHLAAVPRNVHGALEILSNDLRTLIPHINAGKGKPVSYTLLPLTTLNSHTKFKYYNFITSQKLDENLLLQFVVPFFDDISVASQKFQSLSSNVDTFRSCLPIQDVNRFNKLKSDFENLVLGFKFNLSQTVTAIKSGELDSSSIPALVSYYKQTENSESQLQSLGESFQQKIDIYQTLTLAGVEYLGKGRSFEAIRWQTMDRTLYALFFNLTLMEKDPRAWEENSRLLLGGYLHSNLTRLVAIDCDHHLTPCKDFNQTLIQEFKHGALTLSLVTASKLQEIRRGSGSISSSSCSFELLALELLERKYRDLEESSGNSIRALNETIQNLVGEMENRSDKVIIVSDQVQPRKMEDESIEIPELQAITEEFIVTLMNQPKARLYSQENFTGKYEDYTKFSSWNKGICFNLLQLNQQIQSVDTFGSCIRLFQFMDCAGYSLAIYPGSSGSPQKSLDPILEGVFSVGPCLPNEFDNAMSYTVTEPSTKQLITKKVPGKRTTPDLILFGGLSNYVDSVPLWDKENPITNFKQGENGRVEYIRAFINSAHLREAVQIQQLDDISNRTREAFDELERHEGDIVGYSIPLKYGGPEDELYNLFPQSESSDREWKEELEEALADNVNGGSYAIATIHLNFLYYNQSSTRPWAFAYHASINGHDEKIIYGFITN